MKRMKRMSQDACMGGGDWENCRERVNMHTCFEQHKIQVINLTNNDIVLYLEGVICIVAGCGFGK